jgi:hypothetical protein
MGPDSLGINPELRRGEGEVGMKTPCIPRLAVGAILSVWIIIGLGINTWRAVLPHLLNCVLAETTQTNDFGDNGPRNRCSRLCNRTDH